MYMYIHTVMCVVVVLSDIEYTRCTCEVGCLPSEENNCGCVVESLLLVLRYIVGLYYVTMLNHRLIHVYHLDNVRVRKYVPMHRCMVYLILHAYIFYDCVDDD